MRALRWVALALFAVGVALLAVAVARGEAVLFLIVVFPVVQATGPLAIAAVAALVGGMLLLFVAFALPRSGMIAPPPPVGPPPPTTAPRERPPRRTRAGGVVFLGPFPIVFGSDAQVARWMVVVAAALFVLLLAFWLAVALL